MQWDWHRLTVTPAPATPSTSGSCFLNISAGEENWGLQLLTILGLVKWAEQSTRFFPVPLLIRTSLVQIPSCFQGPSLSRGALSQLFPRLLCWGKPLAPADRRCVRRIWRASWQLLPSCFPAFWQSQGRKTTSESRPSIAKHQRMSYVLPSQVTSIIKCCWYLSYPGR